MMKELREALESAERTLGIKIDAEIAAEVLLYTVRKCQVQQQEASYLPILFETELLDHYMRMAINARTEMRCCHV